MKHPLAVAAALMTLILVLTVSVSVVYLNGGTNSTIGSSPTPSPIASLSNSASPYTSPTPFEVQHYTYTIANTYPHDPTAFTEGLVYDAGYLYESTGSYPEGVISTLRRVDLTSGNVVAQVSLPSQYFGEGIAIVNDTIVQLTWQSHLCFVYNKTSLALIGNFSYPTDGWGLTYNGTQLIMSDGSNNLYFLNPATFQRVGEIQVHEGTVPITQINELEYINGSIYANIFESRQIVIINPETGQVTGRIDLSGLQGSSGTDPNFVLNGIGYDTSGNRLFVTGKDWPDLYEIKLVPAAT